VGSSSSKVFATAGSYAYHCNAHQSLGMTGTVVVDAGSAVDSALVQVGAGGENLFTPATASNHTAVR